ncbi:MAG: hypothetical protein ACTHQ3_12125 [Motilibacteraceae bacterium]
MTRVTVSLDADLVIDLVMVTGAMSAQDAVELAVRDAVARGRRTETVTGSSVEELRAAELRSRQQRDTRGAG